MDNSEFYGRVATVRTILEETRLSSGENPLSVTKQKYLNDLVAEIRVLREVYGYDPLIKAVCTNVLAGATLVDSE